MTLDDLALALARFHKTLVREGVDPVEATELTKTVFGFSSNREKEKADSEESVPSGSTLH